MAKLNNSSKSKKRKAKQDPVDHIEPLAELSSKSQKPNAVEEHPSKKLKGESRKGQTEVNELDTSRPSAVFKPKKGRNWTLSIALPGSFIANTKSPHQKYELAGRIARAAAIFCVDEIVVFDDAPNEIPANLQAYNKHSHVKADLLAAVADDAEPWDNPDQFLFHVLAFLECPGHLRRHLFDIHPNLEGAGALPTLDMPHHMRRDEWCQYREGVALHTENPSTGIKKKRSRPTSPESFTNVECGLSHPVRVGVDIPQGSRVTLKFPSADAPPRWPHLSESDISQLDVSIAEPEDPRQEAGYYWGYNMRKATSLSKVYQECPYEGGYAISLGTSERGVPLSSILPEPRHPSRLAASNKSDKPRPAESEDLEEDLTKLPYKTKHLILVFGGVAGLEPAVASDPEYNRLGVTKETASDVFDFWVNLVPGQGSRTIRTEEAVLLGLMSLRGYLESMDEDEIGQGLDEEDEDMENYA